MQPSNKDTREKYELTLKEYKAQKLSQALSYDDNKKISVDVNDIFVEKSYAGPRLDSIDDISSDWIVAMMKWQKEQKQIHRKYATMIIQKACEIFEKDENLVHISIEDLEEITVCGDIHG